MIASLLLALQGSVVLVVLDDVGQKDLDIVSQNGFAPNIDYLKSCGIEYRNAHANPTCSPSRRSLLFGEYYTSEADSGCNPPTGKEPPLSAVSIAETIGADSYFVGKWHLGSNPNYPPWETAPQSQGFATWRAGTPVNLQNFCLSSGYSNWLRVDNGHSAITTAYNPIAQMNQAVSDIQDAKALGLPFFLVLSLNLAHGPFHNPAASLLPPGYPTATTMREKYEAMICAADTIVGHITAEMDLAEDAIIVIGDNGTPQQVAPDPEKAKTTTFGGGIDVPLIASCELLGPLQGTTSQRLVHITDVYPTVAQWFGAAPMGIDGISLFAAQTHASIVCGTEQVGIGYDRCARGPRFKFRRYTDDQAVTTEYLYDLLVDPDETVNQVGNVLYVAQETALRATLDAFEAR